MTRSRSFTRLMLTLAAVLYGTAAVSQTAPAEAQTDWLQDLASRISVHGYAQAGFTYTHREGHDDSAFDLKRTLVWANARITDRWSFLFMHDFSSVVQEFYTDYRLTSGKALSVRFGQFKNRLTIENPIVPTILEAIDVCSEGATYLAGCGSDPLFGVQYGRDLGLALYGQTNNGALRYEVDIMNGQGVNRKDANAEKDFIGRLEYHPTEALSLVATGQVGRGHAAAESPYNPGVHAGDDYRRNRWTAGFNYRAPHLSLRGEYLEGRDGSVTSRGAYTTCAVPLGQTRCDLVGSYDFFNFNTRQGMDQHKVIAGLQYWFYQQCRLQVQYVYKSAAVAGGVFTHQPTHAVMCQMQVRFH